MNLRFREDFTNEIHRPLHTNCMAFIRALHHDGHADDVSSCGDVEQQILTRQWGGEDRGLLEMMLIAMMLDI
jgi:hypothetical protein